MLESAEQALAREIDEELGVGSQVGRLLWVVENFFELEQRRYHEVGLYFLIDLPASTYRTSEFPALDVHVELVMLWIPLAELSAFDVRPAFLRRALLRPPAQTQHVLSYD